jgi:hypothetical protein
MVKGMTIQLAVVIEMTGDQVSEYCAGYDVTPAHVAGDVRGYVQDAMEWLSRLSVKGGCVNDVHVSVVTG